MGKCLKKRTTLLQLVLLLYKHPQIMQIVNCFNYDPGTNTEALRGIQNLTEICRENIKFFLIDKYNARFCNSTMQEFSNNINSKLFKS